MTTRSASPTALYGEVLSNEQQYRKELAALCSHRRMMTQQEEQRLTEQAQAGDTAARETIIVSLLPCIERYAARLFQTYAWTGPSFAYLDLVQEGNMTLLSHLDQALEAHNAFAYLTRIAYRTMAQAMKRFRSLIITPDTPTAHPFAVESFSKPVDEDRTLLDVLSDAVLAPDGSQGQEEDYTALYQELDTLKDLQKQIVMRHFGLGKQAPEPLMTIEKELGLKTGRAGNVKAAAMNRLAFQLTPVYPHYCKSTRQAAQAAQDCPPVQRSLTTQQEERLSHAYAALQTRGEPVTLKALAKEAHISAHIARQYLNVHGLIPPPRSIDQRLDEAYASLQAMRRPLTVKEVAAAAGVGDRTASYYLHRRHNTPMVTRGDYEQRQHQLDAATARLQAQGARITMTGLAQEACMTRATVRKHRREQQSAQSMVDAM